jgi:sugar phosphate isomerase/epimerase
MASEYFYGGKLYANDPKYSNVFSGYSGMNTKFSDIGTSMDARTANQVKEASKHLNTGIKVLEVAAHSPQVFEAMPNDQLKELNRLAKLTGAELTIHAPMIDPTGITDHGWDEMYQKAAENQLWNAIERSHMLNPKGNVNVTFHASTTELPAAEMKVKEGGKEVVKSVLYITPDGRIGQLKGDKHYFPDEATGKIATEFNPEQELKKKNKETWTEQLANLNYHTHQGAQIADQLAKADKLPKPDKKYPETEMLEEARGLSDEQKKRGITHGELYLKDAYRNLKANIEMISKNLDPNSAEKKKIDSYIQTYAPQLKNYTEAIEDPTRLKEFAKMIEEGVDTLRKIDPEKINLFRPLKDFAAEKSAETAANLALKAYNKFSDTAPIISLENHPAYGSLLTTGEDLKNVIVQARKKFVEKAVAEGNLSASEAETQAKKLIGATWDVGHINMLRRYGYDDKDIIKETEKVAPFVKHVHLSDNFGFEHTELPMGMGNVPIKEMMQKLGEKGFSGKKVAEALSWWQHFSENGSQHALIPTLQGMGTPVYGGGANWNQLNSVPGGYFAGYGTMLPENNFSMYGAGFSNLPMEFGGQISGKDSRFSGTPMD